MTLTAEPGNSKRKVRSTTDANPIGRIGAFDIEIDLLQTSFKRQRTGMSYVRFDGVVLPNNQIPIRRATKEKIGGLFKRAGQEFRAIAKTCEEIAMALD